MKKFLLIFIAILILFYVYQFINRPAIGVEKDLRPYLEGCLACIINNEFDKIYEIYIHSKQSSLREFNKGMNHLKLLYGRPISYFYIKSYIGGAGYFIQYSITFEKGENRSCTFSFPIEKKRQIIGKNDLERLSISGDFGKKQFTLFFETGRILACRHPEGCFDEEKEQRQIE
jgi:hypothetical protein